MSEKTSRLISLNGNWDFMPVYGQKQLLKLPEKIEYEETPVIVPSSWRGSNGCNGMGTLEKYPDFRPMDLFDYPDEWNDAECGVLHRKFSYNKKDNDRVFLKFEGLSQYSVIYLNGEEIGEWNEIYLPLEIEITDKIKEANELYVLCSSFKKVTIPSGLEKVTDLVGSWYGYIVRGIWQDVMLVVTPECYISDVEVATFVGDGRIDIKVEADNKGEERSFDVCASVFDKDGIKVKEFVSVINSVCGKSDILISEKWTDAIYWDCENPYLYTMKVDLVYDDDVIHTKEVRFGFREFTADGQNFLLNGVRVNLRGDSWHFQGAGQMTKEYALNWCKLCKQNGSNSIRLHAEPHPEMYLEAADECGILIVDETAIYGSAKTMAAYHPDYIENCRKHIKRLVKRDKNHASVVIWSLQNEMRWVDGRDEYKKYVPEFIGIFHENDMQKRLVSLDGDNRLIDKEHTEVASLHYNIDGTINQWDRKTPLTIGEHGGLWYICPQNSSMYLGLKVYQDADLCGEGISVKEQIFMEYARLQEVSGISSFNFAHYFAESMPDEDIVYENWQEKEWGVNPKKIRKYSLTIDNGNLPEKYPFYKENPTCKYAREGMRPVTVVLSEYNHSFYDDEKITKTLNVFNDTLKEHNVRVEVEALYEGKIFFSEKYSYKATPGVYNAKKVYFDPVKVSEKSAVDFIVRIYHDDIHMYTYNKVFFIYPASLKTTSVTNESAYYYGNDEDFEKISALVPEISKISSFKELKNDKRLLIIGSNIKMPAKDEEKSLVSYKNAGGNVILTEQFSYAMGEMTINKMDFLRAHASDYSHPVLKGIDDDDLTYWNEAVYEEGPDPFIHGAYEKPVEGDYTIILESSYGDFNDGGDLWSPLLEYRNNNSVVLACQLDIMKNFLKTPQACVILRNMIEYALSEKTEKIKTAVFVTGSDKEFLDKAELLYNNDSKDSYEVAVVSASLLEKYAEELKKAKKIFVMSAEENDSDNISKIAGADIKIIDKPVYELKADYSYDEVKCVSIVDLFGYDKPVMSPRETCNRHIAHKAVIAEGADVLIENISGNHWEDIYINGYTAEYCKRALARYNKDNKETPVPYYVKKNNVYICTYDVDNNYEKSIRVYTKLLSNLGCEFKVNKMDIVKDEAYYSLERIMSLPYYSYQDYDRALEYYSDPVFSLNNLGEGLYGWMKKYERMRNDGFMKLHDTIGKTMFITSFVHYLKAPGQKGELQPRQYKIDLQINSKYTLYINGKKVDGDTVTLMPGNNRLFILAEVGDEELSFRCVFKNEDGTFADNLMYRVTTDEVDPK